MNLKEWEIAGLLAETLTTVTIRFPYPALEPLYHLEPKQRVQAIKDIMAENVKRVAESGLIQSYTVFPKRGRPSGVHAQVSLGAWPLLCESPFVGDLTVESVGDVVRKKVRVSTKKLKFFCVKMTVAIQIETATAADGMQKYEERYVLIKATSFEDAYQRVEATRDDYVKPYLNSGGYLVRWKIESLDDCYETGIEKVSEFNDPEGVEVFSILKNRRLTPEREWDGK